MQNWRPYTEQKDPIPAVTPNDDGEFEIAVDIRKLPSWEPSLTCFDDSEDEE